VRFLLLPLGTFGDVKPFLEVGTALLRRGHEVMLATAEPFRELVQSRGLTFQPILTASEHSRFLTHPDLWHRRRFFASYARTLIVPSLKPIVELVRSLARPQELTLVAAYTGSCGARTAEELTGARHLSLWVDPAVLRSRWDPPALSGLEFLPRLPPPWVDWLYWVLDRHTDWLLAGPLNRLRQSYGLKPVRSVLTWMVSRHRSVCLFPPWYCAPQPDWPSDARTVGFALAPSEPLPPLVEAFLDQGPPPVVITFGTGMGQALPEFSTALAACHQNGQRALLVAPPGADLPDPLPADCAVLQNRPPFEALLPRARAIIHHGGIGTVAQALAAGIPQLAVPLAHDHPDNAARLLRLGVGLGIPRWRFQPARAGAGLARILAPEVATLCRDLARRLAQEDGLEASCRALEDA
jgi:UDP:flavonoid glycosyltransferase YjiC (YdhE family)